MSYQSWTDDWDVWKEVLAEQRDRDAFEAEEREQYEADRAHYGEGNPLLGRKDNLR